MHLEDDDLKTLLEYMNEDVDNKAFNYETIILDKTIRCYRRQVKDTPMFLIKAISIVEGYSREEIFRAISEVKLRMSWDTVFRDFRIVQEKTDDQEEVIYMALSVSLYLIV